MPDRRQVADEGEEELVLFALTCLAALRAGALAQPDLLGLDEAVRGLQLLAERDALPELDGDEAVARMEQAWQRLGPRNLAFRPEWLAVLPAEQRALGDALELATATVNYWERGPGG